MIKLTQVPPGLAAGATWLVECDETLCRRYCVNSSIKPSCTISFLAGTATVNDGVAIIPVTATVTVTSPSDQGCGCAHTQLFTEAFNLPLTATTANTVTLTPSSTVEVESTRVSCCKAKGVRLTTVLEATIA